MRLYLFNKNRQQLSVHASWKGYETEKLLDIIHEKDWSDMNDADLAEMLHKVLNILSSYYDDIKLTQRHHHSSRNLVPMLSNRQMITFCNALACIRCNDIWGAVREWNDFIHNYGGYKKHCLNPLETYIIYMLAQQIIRLL